MRLCSGGAYSFNRAKYSPDADNRTARLWALGSEGVRSRRPDWKAEGVARGGRAGHDLAFGYVEQSSEGAAARVLAYSETQYDADITSRGRGSQRGRGELAAGRALVRGVQGSYSVGASSSSPLGWNFARQFSE